MVYKPTKDRTVEEVKRVLRPADVADQAKKIRHYVGNPIDFIIQECRTLSLGPPPTYLALPNKPHIRDLIRIFTFPWKPGQVVIIGKSRQMQATWIACCYVVYCLLFKRNYNIVWSSLKEEHAQAVLDRILKILKHLSIITPHYERKGNYIIVPSLDNSVRGVPRGDTQITSFAYSLWIADEFAKIQPARLQDKIFREALPALALGQIFFISSAYPDTLYEVMYTEP